MSLESLRIHSTAIEISADIITLIGGWPSHMRTSLGDQLQRAVVSVASNIAEGYGRVQTGERLQFLFYADGSIQEAKSQIMQASTCSLISPDDAIEHRKRLTRLSISIIEFCAALLDRDPSYNGKYRQRVEARRRWLVERPPH